MDASGSGDPLKLVEVVLSGLRAEIGIALLEDERDPLFLDGASSLVDESKEFEEGDAPLTKSRGSVDGGFSSGGLGGLGRRRKIGESISDTSSDTVTTASSTVSSALSNGRRLAASAKAFRRASENPHVARSAREELEMRFGDAGGNHNYSSLRGGSRINSHRESDRGEGTALLTADDAIGALKQQLEAAALGSEDGQLSSLAASVQFLRVGGHLDSPDGTEASCRRCNGSEPLGSGLFMR